MKKMMMTKIVCQVQRFVAAVTRFQNQEPADVNSSEQFDPQNNSHSNELKLTKLGHEFITTLGYLP